MMTRASLPRRPGSGHGARPLKRAIQTWLQNLLAVSLLEGKLGEGDQVLVDVAADGEELTFERAGEPATAP